MKERIPLDPQPDYFVNEDGDVGFEFVRDGDSNCAPGWYAYSYDYPGEGSEHYVSPCVGKPVRIERADDGVWYWVLEEVEA